jgi:DNA gyrase/topoisomerase IV subunit B
LDDFFDDAEPVAVVAEPKVKAKVDEKALRKDDIVELTDREHCLKRPTIYIGNVKEEIVSSYLYGANGKILFQDVHYNAGLLKIISEIIDNGVDEAVRCQYKYGNKIDVNYYSNGSVKVTDNGRGLPIELKEGGKYTPEVIFTHLKAGSNFNDEGRQTLGANGVGSSLTNIFSKKFGVDTANGSKRYQQEFAKSFQVIGRPRIVKSKLNYTTVEFTPDYDYFGVSPECKEQLPQLIYKRLVNLSFCFPEITFTFNGTKIAAKNLKQFLHSVHQTFEYNEDDEYRCRIGVFCSETEFQHISFVNGLDTVRGGSHIEYITSAIVDYIRGYIKKKYKIDVKPIDIKSKLFIMLSMRMINAQFDGQTKERLTNTTAEIKSILDMVLDEKFLKSLTKNDEIILPIVETYKLKLQVKENLELADLSKEKKKVKIEKYLPATKENKYLVFTEGDSANGLLASVLGRTEFSYFPLRGKPLNTLEVTATKIRDNVEMKSIITLSGLRLDKDEQSLTHEFILEATDADADGVSIRSLLLCLFFRYGKSLIKEGKIKYLDTPILVGTLKGIVKKFFFNLTDYNEYVNLNPDDKLSWSYRKGLGSWKAAELKALIEKHGIEKFIKTFEWDDETESLLVEWMSKDTSDKRKEYLRGKSFDINGV